MADQIVFSQAPTTSEAPKPDAVDDSQQQQQKDGERPAWLPDNFKTPEDFRKSFDDQRAELTKLQQEKAEAAKKADEVKDGKKDGEGDKPEDKPDDNKDGKKEGEGKSPADLTEEDVAEFSKELAETGEISDESRAKIKEMFNAPDWAIDTYIAGVKAQNDAASSAVSNAFGGPEAQTEILNWAGQNLSDAEMDTLNKQFESNDMGTVLFAIDALKGKYEAANGKSPARRIDGKANGAVSGTYTSWDQVNRDMADPKYRTDPAFRAEVKEKLRGFNG